MQLGHKGYRKNIAAIIRNRLKQKYPGLKLVKLKEVSEQISISVHDLYIANEYGHPDGKMRERLDNAKIIDNIVAGVE
jgi:hypothetical protein